MERFQTLLLEVWREACRHIEVGESVETIAPMLVDDLPLEQLYVRRIDAQRSCLETVAVGFPAALAGEAETRTECSAAQAKQIVAWCQQAKVTRWTPGKRPPPELGAIVPAGVAGEVLAGPLGKEGGTLGVLVLAAPPLRLFQSRHLALAQVLLEPFSTALDNDRQLHELNTLREAAEADKCSLLVRLGRKRLADTIVGAEAGLRTVLERVELVARSDAPVLIFGETGTGKELIARTIHARSARAGGPVIRVNCGAIPPELIDSELFGHERGAFTGAVEARKGWFERADGGTLFLDEIGELPLAAQVRLLRILQDGWLERVGGQQAVHVDVRIVAATHCDLAVMVADGKFREDLWYRIAVFPIVLPPLRERRDTIPDLARHFAGQAATRFGLAPAMPSAEDFQLLRSYDWPGNVRELAAVIDRAAILGNGRRLEVATALGITTDQPSVSVRSVKPAPAEAGNATGSVSLDAVVREHIERTLQVTKGRIEGPRGAALLLGINPHTLRARMRKLKVDWRRFRQ